MNKKQRKLTKQLTLSKKIVNIATNNRLRFLKEWRDYMLYTKICNAIWMYLWVGALLLAVIVQCLIFMKKAWKHALELGLQPTQIKKGLTTGITISIMPTLPVLLVLLSLMPLLGVPLPWLRLSIIGSAYYETYAATTALECVGETLKLNDYSAKRLI